MAESHTSRLFPHGDPRNGYVDYLRAADMVDNDDMRGFMSQSRNTGADWKRLFRLRHPAMDRRKLAIRFKDVPALIQEGNRKPVRSPYEMGAESWDFLEIRPLKHVGKVMEVMGATSFEDFSPKKGVRLLVELLEFAERISHDSVLHLLVGNALHSYALNTFSVHYEATPMEDREALIEKIRDLLARPTIEKALLGERRFAILHGRKAVFDTQIDETDEPLLASVKEKLRAADSATKEATAARVLELTEGAIEALIRVTHEPEERWLDLLSNEKAPDWLKHVTDAGQSEKSSEETPEGFATVLTRFSITVWATTFASPVRTRARLRMLAASLLLDSYRRKNGAPPASLEAVSGEFTTDHITGKPFAYRQNARHFTLWSEGRDDIEPFGLNNSAPAANS